MIDPQYYGLVDLGIVIVAVLGFAIWQLVSVNREIAKDKRDSEERARHSVRKHRLDDGGSEPR